MPPEKITYTKNGTFPEFKSVMLIYAIIKKQIKCLIKTLAITGWNFQARPISLDFSSSR